MMLSHGDGKVLKMLDYLTISNIIHIFTTSFLIYIDYD